MVHYFGCGSADVGRCGITLPETALWGHLDFDTSTILQAPGTTIFKQFCFSDHAPTKRPLKGQLAEEMTGSFWEAGTAAMFLVSLVWKYWIFVLHRENNWFFWGKHIPPPPCFLISGFIVFHSESNI